MVSDAQMLAPEEHFTGEGVVKAETELTREERKRRRARKKEKGKGIMSTNKSTTLLSSTFEGDRNKLLEKADAFDDVKDNYTLIMRSVVVMTVLHFIF